jgi:hypothetical protein
VGREVEGRGKGGFADDAPGVGFRVVGLHGGEGAEATLLAGEACETHCFRSFFVFEGKLMSWLSWGVVGGVCAVIV